MRYQAHQYLMKFLTKELRLSDRRELLQEILNNSIPITKSRCGTYLLYCNWLEKRLS
ncbi:hypothetical protein [Dapis sp. BLCC M126]|uniref:hypothetical protein n=1 Tax=Dapis sp. BLCC M126 TaxID=3400189 RepID=UPI003CF9DF9C